MIMSEPNKDPTLALVTAAQAGDPEAFNQLVSSFERALKGFILGRIPELMKDDVDDIAQEVWLAVLTRLRLAGGTDAYDPAKGAFYTWLTTCRAKYIVKQWVTRVLRRTSRESPASPDENVEERTQEPAGLEEGHPDAIARFEEQLRLRLAVFNEVLRLAFLCGGYPHQQLAFGYSKLLYGRTVQGDSRKVDAQHGHVPLAPLCEDFWRDYCAAVSLDAEASRRLSDYLAPVRTRAAMFVEDLFKFSPVLLAQLRAFHGRVAGTLSFRDHYTQRGFTTAIPDWCDKVARRVRAVLGLESDAALEETVEELAVRGTEGPLTPRGCQRCKLRDASPCRERLAAEFRPALTQSGETPT